MDLYSDMAAIAGRERGSVLAIGNFDGVHRGHRLVLEQAKALAQAEGRRLGVVTFEPHPRSLFRPDDPPFRLTTAETKQALLSACGVDFTVALAFDWGFASQSAEQFADRLRETFAPSRVFIGEDFRFGQLRKGSSDTMRAAGIAVTALPAFTGEGGAVYSSTAIRAALRAGDVPAAAGMLGRDWEITGRVFRGDRRGHELGYPTANVPLGTLLHPAYGIYACFLQIDGEADWHMAATNIGIRPMFELKQGQVEAHILDFPDRDIYDRTVRIRLVARLRGEARFASLPELVSQIERDCAEARRVLGARHAI